jgi:hypothetical protein
MYRVITQFKETGNVGDKRVKGGKHNASVRTEEVSGVARDIIIKSLRKICDF